MPPLAFAPGFEPGGAFSVLLVFLGFVLFAAARALTLEEESLFSASVVYLALGLAAAGVIHALGIRWIDPFENASPDRASDGVRARGRSVRQRPDDQPLRCDGDSGGRLWGCSASCCR